ncbi:hypothetical protein Tco_1411765 [Tanacetum coccineum]
MKSLCDGQQTAPWSLSPAHPYSGRNFCVEGRVDTQPHPRPHAPRSIVQGFKECDFVDSTLNDIEDMLLLKSLIYQKESKMSMGVESYQKKLNITKPQKDFPRISAKELYTPSFDPPGVFYEDLSHQKRLMRTDELYKFSDGMLKKFHDTLHHRLFNFQFGYNKDMLRRRWSDVDKKRSGSMVDLIDKHMLERRILRNLESLVGARELKMDYRLMQRTV